MDGRVQSDSTYTKYPKEAHVQAECSSGAARVWERGGRWQDLLWGQQKVWELHMGGGCTR